MRQRFARRLAARESARRDAFTLALHGAACHIADMTFEDSLERAPRRTAIIKRHGAEAFAAMRKAGQMTAQALDMLVPYVKPGVTTQFIDKLVFDFAMDHGVYPATLHYRGYPRSCCISINEVVCHGIPSERKLQEGDIANIDITLIVDGWHGDSSRMYPVGSIKPEAKRLIDITYEALMRGVRAVRPGATTGDIGHAIQSYIQSFPKDIRCSIVRDFCGHGLGQLFHDAPNILHYGNRGEGAKLEPGNMFTIEPMINLGKLQVRVLKADGWTAVTSDGKLSAQFEHTVGVTDTGVEIFTLSPGGLFNPLRPEPV
jgi:methionyl aminopeptidase